jgi:sulfane dehydrogenase subunit SoxC
VLAEGADGSSMTRTIPMELVESGEVLVAYGQNGEMLRPENGYPLRLVVPGVQGVSWVKYLRRIEVGDKPYAAKDEAMHYIDLMPDGLHRQYTSIQECKSVVTTPSGGQVLLDKGFYNITGWPGRGAASIKRSTCRSTAGATGAGAAGDARCCPSA